MTKTNNHRYSMPEKGTRDWHVPLNENFNQIDKDVPIRDVDANKGNYQPRSGAKFEAIDAGAVYYGDGSDWIPADRLVNSLETGGLTHTPQQDVPQSIHANLSQGHCVGLGANGNVISANPDGYASDDAAIQAVNDWLSSNSVPGGDIYIPAAHPSKSEWVIENTVIVGDPDEASRVRNNLYFVGFPYRVDASGHMTTTINDGSQMFRVVGDTGNSATRGFTWRGGTFNLGGNNAGLVSFEYVTNVDIALEWLKDFRGDGVVFDSRAYEAVFRRCRFKPDDPQSTPTANCIVFQNSYGTQAPAQVMIGEGVNTDGDHNVSVLYRDPMPSAYIAGKYEGANGRATIDVGDPGGPSCVFITPKAHIGNNHSGAHGVYFDGYKAIIAPSYVTQVDGDGIVINGAKTCTISNDISYNSVGGDAIVVNENQSTSRVVVPHEAVVGQGNETVNYPDAPWYAVRYQNGWRLFDEGTTTIPAGESRAVTNFGSGAGGEHYGTIEFASDPTNNVELAQRVGWNASADNPSFIIEETTGSGDANVRWRFFVR